ncbi:MAG TPA: hypothetical protein VGM90_19115 [Kofleriaceae bacterium]
MEPPRIELESETSGRWPWFVGVLVVLVIAGAGWLVFTSSSFKAPPPTVDAPPSR